MLPLKVPGALQKGWSAADRIKGGCERMEGLVGITARSRPPLGPRAWPTLSLLTTEHLGLGVFGVAASCTP